MYVNCNWLRLRQIDRKVIWVKGGDEVDESLLPAIVTDRLTRTGQLVADKNDLGKRIDYSQNKKMPKASNKALPKKVVKKVVKKSTKKGVKK